MSYKNADWHGVDPVIITNARICLKGLLLERYKAESAQDMELAEIYKEKIEELKDLLKRAGVSLLGVDHA